MRSIMSKKPWTAVRVNGAESAAEATAAVTFEASGRLHGSGGCNRISGNYVVASDGKTVKIGSIASTRLLCPLAVTKVERALILALEMAKSARVDRSGRLLLLRDGVVLAIFK